MILMNTRAYFKIVFKLVGQKLLKRAPDALIEESLGKLIRAHDDITRGSLERENWLKQCLDLQLFNREADQLDASTSAHEAVLGHCDLGNSLDEVKALEKRHRDLEKTLAAQDERFQAFNDVADKLVSKRHYDADK